MRTSGTTSTFYYYDGLTVIAEKQQSAESGNWDWQRIFTVAPGVIGNIFRISEMSGGNWTDAYYHYDAIGNVVLRTNGYGSIIESIDQEAYGNVKIGSQSGYHLTTKEYDSVVELYYFCQRWYDNNYGLFNQVSPISLFFEKPYQFSLNNPLNRYDLNGLISIGGDLYIGIGGSVDLGIDPILYSHCRTMGQGRLRSFWAAIYVHWAGGFGLDVGVDFQPFSCLPVCDPSRSVCMGAEFEWQAIVIGRTDGEYSIIRGNSYYNARAGCWTYGPGIGGHIGFSGYLW